MTTSLLIATVRCALLDHVGGCAGINLNVAILLPPMFEVRCICLMCVPRLVAAVEVGLGFAEISGLEESRRVVRLATADNRDSLT